MTTLLIVEDDKSLNQGIALTLARDGLTVRQAYDCASARSILGEERIDLILLDVRLPDGSGFDLCRSIRADSQVPILFLTANDLETDVVTGFELGGDDYITKPFSLMVLRARVMARLRRDSVHGQERIALGQLVFDFGKMEYWKDGRPLILSKTEQKLLKALVMNRGNILTREQLMDKLWMNDADFVDENALTVTVKRLRAKIEDDPAAPVFIKTVYGLGYMWSGSEKNGHG